ncbi:MAG: hypothetical protein KGH65_00750 [Candidatus Micrarchaeota archaeon]|nr:hypothetical protein [Candidatus Micrarchaeota archaeon]
MIKKVEGGNGNALENAAKQSIRKHEASLKEMWDITQSMQLTRACLAGVRGTIKGFSQQELEQVLKAPEEERRKMIDARSTQMRTIIGLITNDAHREVSKTLIMANSFSGEVLPKKILGTFSNFLEVFDPMKKEDSEIDDAALARAMAYLVHSKFLEKSEFTRLWDAVNDAGNILADKYFQKRDKS